MDNEQSIYKGVLGKNSETERAYKNLLVLAGKIEDNPPHLKTTPGREVTLESSKKRCRHTKF